MERRLTAILAADVVRYSRLMERDEAGTLAAIKVRRKDVLEPLVAKHHGRIFKLTGDGALAEFGSAVNAVRCAIDLQHEMAAANEDLLDDRCIVLRIGINLGDIVVEDGDCYGDGVNLAARLEGLAEPGGICISQSIHDQIGGKIDARFTDSGEQYLKNIARPIRVWRWVSEADPTDPKRGILAALRDRPGVAVLPFVNMSGDPEQEYFSDGITEDIITDLSRVSGVFVPARSSSFIYKGTTVTIAQICEALGVRYVLEGGVRKAGSRVRITAQLIDGQTGGHLWADRFDRDLTDVFAVQDEIAKRIVESLQVTLLSSERQAIEKAPTNNLEAYQFYLRGRQFLHHYTKSSWQVAQRMFRRAIDLDPNYARAHAGLADCDCHLYLVSHSDVAPESILAASAKALALDSDLAEAHASRGLALAAVERYEEAEQELQTAMRLDHSLFESCYFLGWAYKAQAKHAQAAAAFERACEIQPGGYRSQVLLGQAYRALGRDRAANDALRRGLAAAESELARHPENADAAALGAGAAANLGQPARAKEWAFLALSLNLTMSLCSITSPARMRSSAMQKRQSTCWSGFCRLSAACSARKRCTTRTSIPCATTRAFAPSWKGQQANDLASKRFHRSHGPIGVTAQSWPSFAYGKDGDALTYG
jgi:adenylate cyclase